MAGVQERHAVRESPPSRYVSTPLPSGNRQYTAEELLAFPSDLHFELIEGNLRPLMMPTGDTHGSCTALLTAFLVIPVAQHNLGSVFAAETGFLLQENPDVVKSPDFAFVAKLRMSPFTGKHAKVTPDLVLETRSPSDRKAEIERKIAEWLSFGTKYVLDMNPAKETLTVYRPGAATVTLARADTFTAEDILPGFNLPLYKVFLVI